MVSAEPARAGGGDEAAALAICQPNAFHGLGVLTLAARRAGEVVHRFTGAVGPVISQHSLQVGDGQHIADTQFIGFLSHGCEPNCRLDMGRFELVALRDVEAGGLLTIDYAHTEDRLYRQFACHCGAGGCRYWITGRAEEIGAEGLSHIAALTPVAAP